MVTLAMWSGAILGLGFVLQVTLLVLLARRRLAAEVWVFTGLLLFYAVRSVALYGLMRPLPRETYGELYSGLSLADFVLQLSLAAELLASAVRSTRNRLLGGAAMLATAAGITKGLAALLPARSPVPADRGTIFTGVLFALLFGVAARVRLRTWPRAVVTGLAVVGVAGTIAECGKSVAAYHRDGHAYVAWSYGGGAVYVLVLLYWIFNALRQRREATPMRAAIVQLARGTI